MINFIELLKEWGTPTIIGIIIGNLFSRRASLELFTLQDRRDEKKRKQEIATQIISTIAEGDIKLSNAFMREKRHLNQSEQNLLYETKIEPVYIEIAKTRDVAEFYIGEAAAKLIIELNGLIREDVDITFQEISQGKFKGGRLSTRDKYDKIKKKLNKIIKEWIENN